MTKTVTSENYFFNNKGLIFRADVDYHLQKQAYKANSYGVALIQGNKEAKDNSSQWKRKFRQAAETVAEDVIDSTALIGHGFIRSVSDPWFWVAMHHLSRPPIFYGGIGRVNWGNGCDCSGCNCSGGGGKDGEAVALLLLIAAAAILIVAIIGTLFFAGKQGVEAEKTRQQLDEVKKLRRSAQERVDDESKDIATYQKIEKVYAQMTPLLQESYTHQALQTTFTVSLAIGFCLFTASAIIAIYCLVKGMPMSPLTINFAIGGGVVAGIGLVGHVIRYITAQTRREAQLELYRKLYGALHALCAQVVTPHPYEILANSGVEKAILRINTEVYIKDKGYRTVNVEEMVNYKEYTSIELPTRSKN